MPKIGETDDDIQDAIAVSQNHNLIAIADGVSSSLFPREWATILVQAFCSDRLVSVSFLQKSWKSWLKPLQQKWRTFYLQNITTLPWWAKGSSIKSHGRSTFVGLELKPNPKQGKCHWNALTVGDTCLFIVNRQTQQLRSLPLTKSSEFSNQTDSWSSLPEQESTPPKFWNGECTPNEYFLLATDALAKWILQNYENGEQDWTRLVQIAHRDAFASFVNRLRANHLITDDDTSLIIVEPAVTQTPARPATQPAAAQSTAAHPPDPAVGPRSRAESKRPQDRRQAKPSPRRTAPVQRAVPQTTTTSKAKASNLKTPKTSQGRSSNSSQVILTIALGLSVVVLLLIIMMNFR